MADGARVQLALNVPDLTEAIRFYSQLFNVQPHKVRGGYANFEVAEPPLKLVLFENERAERLNHLGVEVPSRAVVADEIQRLQTTGMETEVEDGVVCCHARQDKVWARDPAGLRWEIYHVTDDMLEVRPPAEPACCAAKTADVPEPPRAAERACCAARTAA
jgi:catechol 2,3-dioxygenase-like lactoylglutathione lyase family enzyme